MIELKNASVRRDGRVLFADVNLQIHPTWKIGLTGNNGTGKSSFFAVLLGELHLDTGEMNLPSSWHIGHMAQEIESTEQSAIDFVLSGDKVWFELNHKINNHDNISETELAHIHAQFDDINGYSIPSKASQIMAGLGFSREQEDKPVASFSGGWRMRLNLAKTLMSRADLLLLDEPTNHLDLDAILWLEDWLKAYDGTLLMISHDQAFLDAVVGNILHIENNRMTLYTGNYSTFVRTRSERLAQQQQQFEKQQATKAHLEDFIRRFKAKASKAKQAQSRVKQLERMTELAPVMADNPFQFRFKPPVQLTSPLMVLDNASVGYNGVPLIEKIRLQITPDSRIGLLGMNGAGKSTVIKGLVGELPTLSGTRKVADSLVLGYFNQHQMDSLDSDASPMLMLQRLAGKTSDADLRAFLGSFDFRGDRIDTPSKLFSGGERARLTLALIVWQRPNVLVLDEPTNHLDLEMRQALSFALQEFEGAVILVSHDREMIATVCDELYLVHDGRCELFEQDIAYYSQWLSETRKKQAKAQSESKKNSLEKNSFEVSADVSRETILANSISENKATPTTNQPNTSNLSKEEQRKRSAEQRKLTAPIRKQIENDEKQLEKLGEKLAVIEEKLGDTGLYEDSRKAELLTLLDGQTSVKVDIAVIEEKLMENMMTLEEMEKEFMA
ncbi:MULTISPECIES: ATP-binding cassette domain-containing protein [unclassified Moraxella]|uniref:ATP-binding cassette domain-containing protein n=1 Tax=unclassified Moraxella TaxID=2685852 RepID=UPI003AF7CB64